MTARIIVVMRVYFYSGFIPRFYRTLNNQPIPPYVIYVYAHVCNAPGPYFIFSPPWVRKIFFMNNDRFMGRYHMTSVTFGFLHA